MNDVPGGGSGALTGITSPSPARAITARMAHQNGMFDTLRRVYQRYIGVGEKVDDLLPFDPEKFIDSLFAQ